MVPHGELVMYGANDGEMRSLAYCFAIRSTTSVVLWNAHVVSPCGVMPRMDWADIAASVALQLWEQNMISNAVCITKAWWWCVGLSMVAMGCLKIQNDEQCGVAWRWMFTLSIAPRRPALSPQSRVFFYQLFHRVVVKKTICTRTYVFEGFQVIEFLFWLITCKVVCTLQICQIFHESFDQVFMTMSFICFDKMWLHME